MYVPFFIYNDLTFIASTSVMLDGTKSTERKPKKPKRQQWEPSFQVPDSSCMSGVQPGTHWPLEV